VTQPMAGGTLRVIVQQQNRIPVAGQFTGEIDRDGRFPATAFEVHHGNDDLAKLVQPKCESFLILANN